MTEDENGRSFCSSIPPWRYLKRARYWKKKIKGEIGGCGSFSLVYSPMLLLQHLSLLYLVFFICSLGVFYSQRTGFENVSYHKPCHKQASNQASHGILKRKKQGSAVCRCFFPKVFCLVHDLTDCENAFLFFYSANTLFFSLGDIQCVCVWRGIPDRLVLSVIPPLLVKWKDQSH